MTADGDDNHEITILLLLGRKAMTNLSSIFKKQRHYLANKCLSSQSYGCSSGHKWMWEVDYKESWALKNWCFWTVIWRGLLRVLWTARRSNWSILKDIRSEYSLEELRLKLQYFGHLMGRTDSFEKTPMLGKIEGKRKRGQQRMRGFDSFTDAMAMSLSKLWVLVMDREAWRTEVHGVTKSDMTEWMNWTEHGLSHQNKTQFPPQSVYPIRKLS